MTDPRLDRRTLNRALLERQFLIERTSLSTLEVVEQLVGLQSQAPTPPYFGLWSRMARFDPADLSTLITDRRIVRIALMRSTIHLASADDCLWLRPTLQPALDQALRGSYGRRLEAVDQAEVATRARLIVESRPTSFKDLGAQLGDRWPTAEREALNGAARTVLPLIQVPPRGLWGSVGTPLHTTIEHWLGQPIGEPSLDDLVVRYLAAYGPATVMDAQAWSGLTRLGEVFDRLGDRLVRFTDDDGARLYDVPYGPRPDPDTPAPARLVAQWDGVLLAHADRRRVLADDYRKRIFTKNGILHGTAWVDGMVRGTWRFDRSGEAPGVVITEFESVAEGDEADLADEATRLLAFAEPDRPGGIVRFERDDV
jgi:hypothetical protein